MRRREWAMFVAGILLCVGTVGCEEETPTGGTERDGTSGDVRGDAEPTDTPVDGATDSGEGDSATDGNSGGDGGGRDGTDGDGMDGDGMDGDGGASCPGSEVVCGGSCVDRRVDDNHCGSCGNACPAEASCTNGSCSCPDYQTLCDGQCVTTALNNDNCGSCGNTCRQSDDEVCNGGECVDLTTTGCPAGTTYCSSVHGCIDTDTNANHCGACDNACPSGQGCASGDCAPKVPVSGAPQKCRGKDPSIEVGFNQNNEKQKCTGDVASSTFRWALCSCEDVELLNNYEFDAFDSRNGPYVPGQPGASVGTNGTYRVTKGEIYGSLWGSGSPGLVNQTPGQLLVDQQKRLDASATYNNKGTTSGDARIGGSVTGNPTFEGDLTVPQNATVDPRVTVQGQRNRSSVNIGTVCQRCKPGNRIPIAQIVDNHRNNNDNSAIGLSTGALDRPGGPRVLELPCGKYFLDRVEMRGDKLTIRATGRTALFIDGDLISDTDTTIRAARGAELDVFVDGKATLETDVTVGSPSFPALHRFYVSGRWTSTNDTALGAFVYAIDGGIDLKNNGEVFGGLYTQNLTTMNNTEVHYDREILDQKDRCCVQSGDSCSADSDCCGSEICGNGTCGCVAKGGTCRADSDCCSGRSCTMGTCGTTATDAGGGMDAEGGDAAGDAAGDTGDADGGGACVQEGGTCSADSECCSSLLCTDGTCGSTCSREDESCSSDGDCCSPLVCRNGTCQASSCNFLQESCTTDGDCCSGTCGCTAGTCLCTQG